jgi:enamine deaminase RidA (YjgF/YER057c/UK114 family)
VKTDVIAPSKHRGGQPGVRAQAVRAGDLIFIGGQMSLDENGKVVGTTVAEQTRNCFAALQRVLDEAGATMADVVKHNVFFDCPEDPGAIAQFMDELDAVRIPLFPAPGPTTTEVRAALDVEGALLLIDAWAIVGAKRELLSPPGHWNWKRKSPFVQGWKIGDMIFVGGQRSLDRNGAVLGAGDIEVQTDHAFRNLDTMLRAGGGDRNNLMRQNTFFRFFAEGPDVTAYWEKMTAVRRRYMSSPSAAGAGLRIKGFAESTELIQVEGIGVLGDEKQRLQPANHWDWSIPGNNFTQGWKIGRLAFIGGQISADDKAKTVGKGDMAAQTRNVFNFIRRTLAEGGLDESDVAKLYIYYHAEGSAAEVTRTRKAIADIQREFYGDPGPAVTAIRVAGFAFEDLLIEIEAMAVTHN